MPFMCCLKSRTDPVSRPMKGQAYLLSGCVEARSRWRDATTRRTIAAIPTDPILIDIQEAAALESAEAVGLSRGRLVLRRFLRRRLSVIGLGVLEFFRVDVVNGIWLAFLGWFLLSAGASEEASTQARVLLKSVPVSSAMHSGVVTVPDSLLLRT